MARGRVVAADAALLAVVAVWGGTFVPVAAALRAVPPFAFLAVRFLVALALLLPWAARAGGAWRRGLAPGLWLFLGYAGQTVGLTATTPARAGFLTGVSVVLVPWLAWWRLRQRPDGVALGAAAVALLGLGLLVRPEARPQPGDGLVLLGAVAFAMQIVETGRWAARTPPLALAAGQLAAVAAGSLGATLLFERADPAAFARPAVLGAVGLTAVLATAVAFAVQSWAQRWVPPAHAALLFAAEPVFAAAASALWAGERLPPSAWIGGALILLAMLAAEWPRRGDRRLAGPARDAATPAISHTEASPWPSPSETTSS